jgi:hypothetical protein
VGRNPGVEGEQAGTVFADHVLRERFVGGIGGDGYEALAEFIAYGAQILLVAGDADDVGARGDERGGDRAPEAAAGTLARPDPATRRRLWGSTRSFTGAARLIVDRYGVARYVCRLARY